MHHPLMTFNLLRMDSQMQKHMENQSDIYDKEVFSPGI